MRRILAAALVTAVALLGACGEATPVTSIDIDLDEYSIDSSSGLVLEGPVTMSLANVGELPHTIVVSTLDGTVVAASEVVPAGETGQFVARLQPGAYEFTCRIVAEFDGALVDHYELGMVTRVDVAG